MSEAEPFAFTAPLTLVTDFRHVHAYLALEPSLALVDALGVGVDWLPLRVPPPAAPPPAAADEDRGRRHRRLRLEYVARDVARSAAARGLQLGDIHRDPDPLPAALGLLWVRQRDGSSVHDYLTRVFEGYWGGELDLADPQAVRALIEELGIFARDFPAHCQGDGAGRLAALEASLRAAGVFDVPACVVGGEVFLGRQHLPMVRWLLEGRTGPPPIDLVGG